MSAVAATAPDRLNPILVKEVRAALRARVFRIVFQCVMGGSVIVAVLSLASIDIDQHAAPGRIFFTPVYLCLCTALLGVVPLSAFFSMGSEWEENTYDLLAISNLRPRQIVLGKLYSSAIEALLYFSAFAPLLVFTFLLRGVDIRALLLVLAVTYAASVGTAATGIGLSSLARGRGMRLLLLVVLGGIAIGLIVFITQMVFVVLRRHPYFGASFFEEFLVAVLVTTVGAGALALSVACERLAHPEENHSTGPRCTVTVLYGLFLLWSALRVSVTGFAENAAIALVLATVAQIFFATERETLTRRVRLQVPRSPVLALLSAPFLPGGGRALLLYAVHVLMAVAAGALASTRSSSLSGAFSGMFPDVLAFWFLACSLFVYVAGITLPFSRRTDDVRVRWVARVAVPLIVLLVIFAPAIVDFMLQHHRWVDMDHPLNPLFGFDSGTGSPWFATAARVAEVLVVLVFLASLRRLDRAVREVLQASRANRDRARGAA